MGSKSTNRSKKSYHVLVNRERCKACYLCLHVCQKGVLEKEEGVNAKGYQPVRVVKTKDCIGCRSCTIVCPEVAFELHALDETA